MLKVSEKDYETLLSEAAKNGLQEQWVNAELQKHGAVCGRDGDGYVLIGFTEEIYNRVLNEIPKTWLVDNEVAIGIFVDRLNTEYEGKEPLPAGVLTEDLDAWQGSLSNEALQEVLHTMRQTPLRERKEPGFTCLLSILEGEDNARAILAEATTIHEQKQLPAVPFDPDKIFEYYGLMGVETIEEADKRIVRAAENIRSLQAKLTDCVAILEKAFKDYSDLSNHYEANLREYGRQHLKRKKDGSFAAKNCELSPFVKVFFRKTGGVKLDDREMLTNWLTQQPEEMRKEVKAEYKLSYRSNDVIKWAKKNGTKVPGTAELPENLLGKVTVGGDKAFSLKALKDRLKIAAGVRGRDDGDEDDDESDD